jgi:hypothetical protein
MNGTGRVDHVYGDVAYLAQTISTFVKTHELRYRPSRLCTEFSR